MATNLIINGATYPFPQTNDVEWGDIVTNWATAVTNGMLQKAGGAFTLTADVNFGASYGLTSLYYKTRSSSIASSGEFRLAKADTITFRNNADSGDLELGINGSDELIFNSVVLSPSIVTVDDTSTIALTITSSELTADIESDSITNAMINSSAAIAYSKLDLSTSIVNADISTSAAIALSKLAALTASRAVELDGSGELVASAVTATELNYLDGVTSALQTQLDGKLSLTGGTISSNLIISGDLTVNGTTTTLNTITLDVEDKNITINDGGNDAASEGAGLTISRTSTDGSLIYADASATKFQIGALGSEVDVADISTAQTFTNKTIDADNNTVSNIGNEEIKAGVDAVKLADGSVSNTEFQYLNGVTSAIQTQLNALANPMDAVGQIIYGGASGVQTKLAAGSSGTFLKSNGAAAPTWESPPGVPTVQSVSSDITLADGYIYLVDTASARSLALPTPVSGIKIVVKDKAGTANTNNITITRAGSEDIEGIAANKILQTDWGSWTFVSDGTDWFMI